MVSTERIRFREALKRLSPVTYATYGLGRSSLVGSEDIVLVAVECGTGDEGRLQAVRPATGPGPLVLDEGTRLRLDRPLWGWSLAEWGADSDVFVVADGPLAGREGEVAQPIGNFTIEREIVAWLVVPAHSPASADPVTRRSVIDFVMNA
jgi:hypothetical protein